MPNFDLSATQSTLTSNEQIMIIIKLSTFAREQILFLVGHYLN